jgi:hypothetical protein
MSIPGTVIAVLVAIALLALLGVSCGAIQGNDANLADLDAGWAEALNDLIGRKPSVSLGDLSSGQAACTQDERLTISTGAACGYFMEPDGAVRELSLRLVTGSSATVAIQQGDFSEGTTLTPGSPSADFDILPDDTATVTITCAIFGQTCSLTVE